MVPKVEQSVCDFKCPWARCRTSNLSVCLCVCEVESAVFIKCIDMNEKVLNVAYV